MTTVYLAARYGRREELLRYAADLRAYGHTVTSRWLQGEHQWGGDAVDVARAYEGGLTPPEAVRFAQDDVEDLAASQVVVSFTERPRDALSVAAVRSAILLDADDRWDSSGSTRVFRDELPHITSVLNREAGLTSRGGRHTEFGMAWAWGKVLVVIGPRENVFHLLPAVHAWPDWRTAIDPKEGLRSLLALQDAIGATSKPELDALAGESTAHLRQEFPAR